MEPKAMPSFYPPQFHERAKELVKVVDRLTSSLALFAESCSYFLDRRPSCAELLRSRADDLCLALNHYLSFEARQLLDEPEPVVMPAYRPDPRQLVDALHQLDLIRQAIAKCSSILEDPDDPAGDFAEMMRPMLQLQETEFQARVDTLQQMMDAANQATKG